ncbi:RNA degradosome polyphosphate kinase [Actinocatenispora comari]|uniref:Polyphosphate kinase n=1 Tax=Actinocatenispora comari TaxID=2807577 RepID=A0A8J4AIC1_9ACTN|nr:RNA degradosome polyphosphate kinase [Actinocatenispora comari]GIL31264.1 polyphosphate kinase [Actinocatenispora comari]
MTHASEESTRTGDRSTRRGANTRPAAAPRQPGPEPATAPLRGAPDTAPAPAGTDPSRRGTAGSDDRGAGTATASDTAAVRGAAEPATVRGAAEPVDREELPEGRFLNRELSWLDFNARVLTLAEDRKQPLLERAKFLAIFASNLDEFYMVRVAGLQRRLSTGLTLRTPDRMPPREQLERISQRAAELVGRHSRCFADDVRPALAEAGVRILRWSELTADDQERLRGYFRDQVFPVLTPLAVDPAHPFPYISGLSLNLAVLVRAADGSGERFARVKVPNNVPRFVTVQRPTAGRSAFLPVEDLIAAHLDQLFPGMDVVDHHVFRVTRNADLEVEEDRDEDLLQAMERELAQRRFGPPVRLEVASTTSDHVLDLLVRELDMTSQDVLRVPGLLDLTALWQIYDAADRDDLTDRPFVPATPAAFSEGETPKSVFATLRGGDVLVHHPYHSFSTTVQRFIEQAAEDPGVLAIKQTLYRTSGDSPVVDALVTAAEAGKQVVAVVEIKARFDEEANISWARKLEQAGCHVMYGLVGLKTHAKMALVVRAEAGGIRRYCHIGTGNYNPKTARTYEDFGLFTADPEVGADATDLFNVLTGYSRQTSYRRLLVAPQGVRAGIIDRIERQADRVRAGKPARIQFKVNSIVDERVIDALYRASRAGVRIDLVVRGICSLRPGVPELSENIRVRSMLGRFLEHSRIFRFTADGFDEFWIGSADLMHRNLDRRVEALVQVTDAAAQRELAGVLDLAMADSTGGFELNPDGSWTRRNGGLNDMQAVLLRETVDET